MKLILGIMFFLVCLWCLCGCNFGGGNEVDRQDTADQSDVTEPLPDSILVRDTRILDTQKDSVDSVLKRKSGQ